MPLLPQTEKPPMRDVKFCVQCGTPAPANVRDSWYLWDHFYGTFQICQACTHQGLDVRPIVKSPTYCTHCAATGVHLVRAVSTVSHFLCLTDLKKWENQR